MDIQRVHVVINPAAGQDVPVLATLNRVFQSCAIDWNVSLTKHCGDGRPLAREAAEAGADVVAVYGGDGTVAEVASGLLGLTTPLAILPGGTGNVMAKELGIPGDLAQACRLLCHDEHKLRTIDVGQVNDQHFLLRVGLGLEASVIEQADRELKNRLGIFAYLWSALQNLSKPPLARYQLTLDGETIDIEGVNCIVANSGNLGLAGFHLAPTIRVDDGLLDVVVIQQASLGAMLELMDQIVSTRWPLGKSDSFDQLKQKVRQTFQFWQAKEVTVQANPPQAVQLDGDMLGTGSIRCRILPQAIQVIVPSSNK
ncbi:MAG: diacylglycerol kinase family lipid kinase [Caldilineaceae bacterium]